MNDLTTTAAQIAEGHTEFLAQCAALASDLELEQYDAYAAAVVDNGETRDFNTWAATEVSA